MPQVDFPETSASLLSTLRKRPNDPEAWARFVHTYGPRILQWCRRWGLQDADARDVTQEVFIQLSRRFGSFKYDDSRRFRGWLRRVAHSSWCDFMERRRDWNLGIGGVSTPPHIETLAAHDDVAGLVDNQEKEESLRRAMERVRARVEPRTWQAFWLLNIDGMSGEQAATKLGMRLGSTYAASAKVRRLIRKNLRREEFVV